MAKAKPTLFEQHIASARLEQPQWQSAPSIRWTAIAASIIVATLCMPSISRFIVSSAVSSVPSVGFRWTGAPIVADRTFVVLKPSPQYDAECAEARERAEPVYEAPLAIANLRSRLRAVFDTVITASLPARQRAIVRSQFTQWSDSLLQTALLVDSIATTRAATALIRLSSGAYHRVPISSLVSLGEFALRMQRFMQRMNLGDTAIVRMTSTVASLPHARYSLERSLQEQELAVSQVPRTLGIVRRGQTIVTPGQLVTSTVAATLAAYRDAATVEVTVERVVRGLASALTRALLLCGIVWLYLARTRLNQHDDNRTTITVASLLIIINLQSWASTILPTTLAPEFLVLLPAAAMIITVLYDLRLAFVFSTSAALLHIAIRSSDVASGIALLVASIAGALGVRSLQSRYQFIHAMLLVAGGFVVSLAVAVLDSEISLAAITSPALAAMANAVVSPLLVYGALLLANRAFDLPTDLRLLELDSLTHPLLVKLRHVAPGTYQHTLNVANLAEHAALAIGANPLLARVGAYFHDIGKMRKPEYFAENQIELSNKHRELSPKHSAAIIRNHVEEGIELALEYRLPPKVIEFIPMHHGTSLIRHFYALALEEAQTTNSTVNEDDFRYPGPKPQTKETGIVMLADVAEAIARTVESPAQIEELLDQVFREKISDGQLDDCPLTLAEIATIRRLFVNLITGMLHGRPEYKSPNRETDASGASPKHTSSGPEPQPMSGMQQPFSQPKP